MTRIATYKGWTNKPIQRSETAKLKSNVFDVFGNEEVFLIAWIVTLFNIMAVYDKKAFKTQLAMSNHDKPEAGVSCQHSNPVFDAAGK